MQKIGSRRTSSHDLREKGHISVTPQGRPTLNSTANKTIVNSCSKRIDDSFFDDQMKTLEKEVNENYRSKSKLSNYDSAATPVFDQNKGKLPEQKEPRTIVQSKVLVGAARSITKTKSISGSFIVTKTRMSKSSLKPVNQGASEASNKESMLDGIEGGRASRLRASVN